MTERDDRVHVIPVGDAVEHDTSGETACVCGPTEEPVMRDDGSNGWLVVHHALDGREHSEPDHDAAACPLCSGAAAS